MILRKATADDHETVYEMMKALADYENLTDALVCGKEGVRSMMENGDFEALLVLEDDRPIAVAIYYFYMLSTFSGRRVLYLEDIFVLEEYRRMGAGGLIFDELIRTAKERNCLKLEWKCLADNYTAQSFYEKRGAKTMDGWLTYNIKL